MDRFRGHPFLDPGGMFIPPEVVASVPASLARAENIMPLAWAGDVLTIAVERPTDFELIDKLRFVCNLQIDPVAAPASAIRAAVARHYGKAGSD